MYYSSRRRERSILGFVMALVAVVMLVHAIIVAAITLGVIVGIAGGIALAFPAVRSMFAPHVKTLTGIGSALRIRR